ncbi:MAG TPA: alkaline phosphatase family protein [Candidatus Paceibacterota bacterium]|nr:alkaline phosphatase family protein [Verrucomicrobiota bacterium]HRY46437.1 alkaline phosphatase family protein [Candidatus Paceibacterota bacterium]HSA02021.1 alkaline phosphatase family protein [Candidatus Paceibacterota bacterium]
MKSILPLFIMIDAMGWEILRHDPFGKDFAPTRKRLESVFGYSSTCVPSILSGRWPFEHRNWCYFVYDPRRSPFASLRWLRWLPTAVTSRRIFRRYLTKFVKVQLGFRGYFDLYNIPFRFIPLFDFTEKKSPLQPGGMNRGPNIFDFLTERGIPYFVTDPTRSEDQNRLNLIEAIETEKIDFAFQYWAGLDGLLHGVGNQSPEIPERLRFYERWIEGVLATAKAHYREVHLYVFSDHGMANCDVLLDLKAKIDALPVRMEKDYAVVYDSTMARFWFFNDHARQLVAETLQKVPEGRIISDEELRRYNAFFEDRYFGELIFLVKEGVLIVPSHMGERPIRAMHGYHPTDPQSYAALCTNQPAIPEDVTHIPHLCRLMEKTALQARERNAIR